jgi:hypothetical protein
MKKLFLSLAILALAVVACQTNDEVTPNQEAAVDMSDFFVYTSDDVSAKSSTDDKNDKCASMKVLNQQLRDNPGLEQRMYDIEKHTRELIATKGSTTFKGKPGGDSGDVDVDVLPISDNLGVINIPVYIHIIYPNANSITDAQVSSQLNVLNSDFRNTNASQLPPLTTFANDATDAGFSFSIAGVFRHNDPKSSWGTNNSVKLAYPPISPSTHLNIWVCEIGGGILGYAQFPGGNSSTDGIVLGGPYFGVTSGAYGGGRTATHEIGHWLNLRHIWGDGRCNADDYVLDTPIAGASNAGCPTFPSVSCQTADMTMNYMDYTYDSCMYLFTDGQRNRMRAIFSTGGSRASFIK